MTPLQRAEAMLAETEESIAAGLGGPYAEKNLATHRARVASLRSTVVAPAPLKPSTPAPAAPTPLPRASTPRLTGTREERLARLAKAMDGDAATLETAIANGTTPDEFAMILLDEQAVKAKAKAIIDA
jgi:hypothetical protein